jgi:hypothetical protein
MIKPEKRSVPQELEALHVLLVLGLSMMGSYNKSVACLHTALELITKIVSPYLPTKERKKHWAGEHP